MRVALTGGGGFIGSHVLARMVGTGMDVTLVGPDPGRSRYAASLIASRRVRFVRCDRSFRDTARLRAAVGDVDAVLLLGYVAPSATDPVGRLSEEIEHNVVPLVRLLRGLEGCPRYVFASTLEVYGGSEADPVDDPRPVTPFGITKLAAECSLRMFADGVAEATILRFASVYGPNEPDEGLVARLIDAAFAGRPLVYDGDGNEERDYVHVCDVAEATLAALQREGGGVYEIGTGVGVRTLDLARLVAELAGAKSPVVSPAHRADEPRPKRLVAATEGALTALGFAARRALVDGLREEIGWVRTKPPCPSRLVLAATA